jgi:hypothetical protein
LPAARRAPAKPKPEPAAEPPAAPTNELRGAAAKLGYIQGHITNVEKTGWNDHHKYNYFQEHGLLNLLRPLLRELRCTIEPSPTGTQYIRDGNRAIVVGWIDFVDTAEPPFVLEKSGEPLLNAVTGAPVDNPLYRVRCFISNEGVDNQDKATNKALTGWMKYALQKLFLVPTDAVDDADDVVANGNGATAEAPPAPTPEQAVANKPVGDTAAKPLIDKAAAAVEAGTLDPNKFKAKLATYKTDSVSKLTADQFLEFEEWFEKQVGAGAAS